MYIRTGSRLEIERSAWPIGRLLVTPDELCIQFLGIGEVRREPPTLVFLLDRVIPIAEVTRLVTAHRFPRGVTISTTIETESIFLWGPLVLATLARADGLPPIEPKPSR